jgi:hypothetical protein
VDGGKTWTNIFVFFQAPWVSVDEGRNWFRLDPPLADGCTYPEMRIDPSDASIYLTCGDQLLKSTDGGASWTPKPLPGEKRLWSLRTGPGAPAILYGNQAGVIWRSIDGGESWRRLGTLPLTSDPRFLTPHPSDPSFIFASTPDGIVRSQDGGTLTLVTEYPLLAESPLRVLIDPQAPNSFYMMNWSRQQLRLGP